MKNRRRFLLWAYTSALRKVVRSAHPLRGRLRRRALTVAELSPESSNLWAYNKKTTPCYKKQGVVFWRAQKDSNSQPSDP